MCDVAAEAQQIVRMAAEPWAAGDGIKAGIDRAARRLNLSYRRARTFWYGAHCAVLAAEMDQLRARRAFLLGERMKRLDAERALIAARLEALKGSHADVVARMGRTRLGGGSGLCDDARGSLPQEAGNTAGLTRTGRGARR